MDTLSVGNLNSVTSVSCKLSLCHSLTLKKVAGIGVIEVVYLLADK